MARDTTLRHYHPALKILHWVIAVLVLTMLVLGFLQKLVKEDFYETVNFWHVNLGFTLLLLMLLRVGVRLGTRTPARAPGIRPWEAFLANLVQALLYVALLCEPLLGFLTTNAQGFPLTWFEFLPVSSPIGESRELADRLLAAHLWLAWAILLLVGLHVAGALYRRIVYRDGTLASIT